MVSITDASQPFKNMKPFEIILTLILIVFIVAPVEIPFSISEWVHSPLGIIIIFGLAVYLFMNASIVVSVIFAVSASELIRRCYAIASTTAVMTYSSPHISDNDESVPSKISLIPYDKSLADKSLEEEIVDTKAPIGLNPTVEYIDTSFKPVMASFTSSATML